MNRVMTTLLLLGSFGTIAFGGEPRATPITAGFAALADDIQPAFAWNAKTLAEHAAWRLQARQRMLELLGRMPSPVKGETNLLEVKEFDDFTRRLIEIKTTGDYWAPVYLYIPHDLKKPRPAVVCLHGHSGIVPYLGEGDESQRKASREKNLAYAAHIASLGYVSAAIVVRGWNQTAGYQDPGVGHVRRSCRQVTMNTLLLGMTPQGLRCWDAMRVIDYLESLPEVNREKIGVAGLSGGGTLCSYLPILDERVKLAMIAGAFSSYRESIYAMPHCICNCLPGVMESFEMSDVIALHAPRPVLLINGIEDPIFPIGPARGGFAKLQQVYEVAGAAGSIEADFFDGGHMWSNAKVAPFLEKHFGRPR